MIRKVVVAASVGLLLSSQVALAAESVRLGGVEGSVLVNQNGRFVPVTSSTVLSAGDKIMAMDGSAKVTYGTDCVVTVGARSMATVSAAAPCAGSATNIVRAYQDDEEEGYGTAPTDPAGQGWDFWVWAGFGVITIGTMAVVLNDSDEPTSP